MSVCVNVFNMHNYIKERLLSPNAQLEAKVKGQTLSLHYMFPSTPPQKNSHPCFNLVHVSEVHVPN